MRYALGLWRCAGIVLLVLVSANTARAQGGWAVTDLGTFGGLFGTAEDINEAGHVVGQASLANGDEHAFLWTASGGMVDLGTLGGSRSGAGGINNAGQVVGSSSLGGGPGGSTHAFLWTATGGMVDLGTLGGSQSSAWAINEAGQVVGRSDTVSGDQHAFLWTAAGGMVDLGTLGGPSSSALDINEAGQVVGRAATASGDEHAFLWTAATGMIDLGTFGGPGSRSQAEGINDLGHVVGLVNDNDDRAYDWTAAGGMIELPTLTGIESGASAINNAGQIAGYGDIATGDGHAVVWNNASNPPTPEEQINSLEGSILDLVAAGLLKSGQATGLTRPLQNALRSLARARIASACSQLSDFQAEVAWKVLDGSLTPEDGVALSEAASSIRTALGC